MNIKLGLLGVDISHSKMPKLQRFLGEQSGLSVEYNLLEKPNGDGFHPETEIKDAIDKGYLGLNITYPFKQLTFDALSSLGIPSKSAVGSCNTIKFAKPGMFSANTDYSGFLKAYRYRMSTVMPGKVLMVGTGGVGRAIAFALAELGCEKLFLYDLDKSKAESLANALPRKCATQIVQPDNLSDIARSADGLVNCTNMGSFARPGSALLPDWIATQRWAFDAVYTPLGTEFLKACRNKSLECLSGFDLWFFQGVDAFEIFTDISVAVSEEMIQSTLRWIDK